MSKFTTEVRFICEVANGMTDSEGYNSTSDIIRVAAPSIFSFDFPIFDENYRLPLETKILRHYYTREISEETVGLWKLRLEDRMNMIMPYYNQLYESELLKFNPFYDVDLRDIHKKDFSGNEDKKKSGIESSIGIEKKDKTQNVEGETIQGTKYKDITLNENEHDDNIVKSGSRENDSHTAESNINVSKGNTKSDEEHNDQNVGSKHSENQALSNENIANEDTTVGTNNNWDLYSDTPQGGIDGIENAASGIAGMGYLTNARNVNQENINKVNGNKNTNSSGNGSADEENFGANRGNKTTNAETNGETTDDSITMTKDNETQNETQNKQGRAESSGIAAGNKDISGKNNTLTNDTQEGFNSLKRENSGNEVVDIYNTEDYAEHILGKKGTRSYSKMLDEFRETFLNIDKMIIDELSDLFFGLWE